MAGEIQLNSTTFATESGGTVTVANVDSATNRQNLGLEIGVDVQAFDADTTKNDVANTFTANQIISVTDNTNAALRVTQEGTGNALVVEDSANPDSTPFVVSSSGHCGIGKDSPSSILHIASDTPIFTIEDRSGATASVSQTCLLRNNDSFQHQVRDSSGTFTATAYKADYSSTGVDVHKWYRANTQETMQIDSSGNLLIGYTSSNGSYKLQVNSQIFATSSTIETSDGRYKENIQPLDSGLAIVQALNPVQFDWKEHPVHQFDREQPTVGFIAQEVQEVLSDKTYKNSIIKSNTTVIIPEELDEDGNVITAEVTEEFLGIAEGNLIAILTKAIQEQQTIIESQQSQIDALTARIEALETA